MRPHENVNMNFSRRRATSFALEVLKIVAVVGVIGAVFVAPGLAHVFRAALRAHRRGASHDDAYRNRVYQTLWRLRKRGLITKDHAGKFALTSKGHDALLQYELRTVAAPPSTRWDGKWRLVAFDVWEKRRALRNTLRDALRRIGFLKIQHSLWAYPYDCEEAIALLRTHLRLSPAIQYMLVLRIDDDTALRRRFHLRAH